MCVCVSYVFVCACSLLFLLEPTTLLCVYVILPPHLRSPPVERSIFYQKHFAHSFLCNLKSEDVYSHRFRKLVCRRAWVFFVE